jgi:hypothetical protein
VNLEQYRLSATRPAEASNPTAEQLAATPYGANLDWAAAGRNSYRLESFLRRAVVGRVTEREEETSLLEH